jgi:hypothetical protein
MILNTNIQNCEYTNGGISRLFLANWKDISDDIRYSENNIDRINSINTYLDFIEFKVERSYFTYSEEMIKDMAGLMYKQTVSLYFSELDYLKRKSINQINRADLIPLFLDRNGKWWIAGVETPLKSSTNTNKIGTIQESNDYVLNLSSVSRTMIKEVKREWVKDEVLLETFVCDVTTTEGSAFSQNLVVNSVNCPITGVQQSFSIFEQQFD